MPDSLIDLGTDLESVAEAAGRWEPCAEFTGAGVETLRCGDCGWAAEDHRHDAVIRRLRAAAPRTARPRRLAS